MKGGICPWDNNDADITNRHWQAASNHSGGRIEDHSMVEAIVLIQDGNMGGSYVRVISWVKDSEERHFSIYNTKQASNSFYFEQPVPYMSVGDVVVNTVSKIAYQVTRIPGDNKFIKVLEPLK